MGRGGRGEWGGRGERGGRGEWGGRGESGGREGKENREGEGKVVQVPRPKHVGLGTVHETRDGRDDIHKHGQTSGNNSQHTGRT